MSGQNIIIDNIHYIIGFLELARAFLPINNIIIAGRGKMDNLLIGSAYKSNLLFQPYTKVHCSWEDILRPLYVSINNIGKTIKKKGMKILSTLSVTKIQEFRKQINMGYYTRKIFFIKCILQNHIYYILMSNYKILKKCYQIKCCNLC